MTTEHRKGIQGAAWLNIVLGALILLTPFFSGDYTTQFTGVALWSAVLSGLVVIALAGYNAYEAGHQHTEKAFGPAMANVVVGLWVLVSPFVFAVSTAYMTAMVIFGIALIAAAGYNTWAASDARKHDPGRRVHV